MLPRLRLLVLMLLAATALVAGGCGSDKNVKASNAYVDKVNVAQTDFAKTVDELSGKITQQSTPAQDRTTMKNFTTAVDRVVADLRAIDPPGKVKDLHAKLVKEISSYGREVASAASALSSGDANRLLAAQQKLLKATSTVSTQINTTIDQINTRLHS